MKLFVLLVIACTTATAAWAASVQLKRVTPTATLEEIIEQFEKTWTGVDEAVQAADQMLKEMLSGRSTLPLVEKALFDAEFVIATIAEGAMTELLENANADQKLLLTNVLRQTGLIVVQTISEIEQIVKDEPETIVIQVTTVLYVLYQECDRQIQPIVDLIEGAK